MGYGICLGLTHEKTFVMLHLPMGISHETQAIKKYFNKHSNSIKKAQSLTGSATFLPLQDQFFHDL